MNKKGFALVELLAVFTILIIIFLLVFRNVKNIISNSEKTIYQSQINTILNASYDWSLENISKLPQEGNKIYITLGQLKYNGYIQSDIKDPKTSKQISEDYVVSIKNVGSKYKNNDAYAKKSGNYLYKIETELMSASNYNSRRPKIILSGSNLEANSNGDYVTIINQNDEYNEAIYTATSYNENDLTDKVIINILYNDNIVKNVDTSKVGIYYINYTVIDNYGYANTVTRNIVVTDTEPPTIIVPETTTISLELDSYDLMKDVTCSDNSGKCNITINGTVDFGIKGKYIIEYVVSDNSGNTESEKRIITIE